MLYALSSALALATILCLGGRLDFENNLQPSANNRQQQREELRRVPHSHRRSWGSRNAATSGDFVCEVDNDLIMVLDSSANMNEADFDKARKFFADFADAFSAATHNRLGFKVFAAQPQTIFELKTPLRPDQMRQFIVTAPYFGAVQNDALFANSLTDALTEFKNDNRTTVDQNFVLITAGKSGEAGNIDGVAKQMTAAGVNNFAVGIGSNVEDGQLLSVAGGVEENVLKADDFDRLGDILDDLIKRVCSDKPPTCHKENDLMVALDDSGSIGSSNYIKGKNFTAQLLDSFVMSGENRVSFRIFSNSDLSIFKLDNTLTRAEVQTKVVDAPYRAGGTATDAALDAGKAEFDQLGRDNVPRNFLIITDGASNDRQKTAAAAQRAIAAGINTFSVGIGGSVNQQELLTIANNNPDRVFTVDDFEQLEEILKQLSAEICEG